MLRALCQNRSRTRRSLSNALEELCTESREVQHGSLGRQRITKPLQISYRFSELRKSQTELSSELQNRPGSFDRVDHITSVLVKSLRAYIHQLAQWILFLGFEQELFQPNELGHLYQNVQKYAYIRRTQCKDVMPFLESRMNGSIAISEADRKAVREEHQRNKLRILHEEVKETFSSALGLVSILWSPYC